MRTRTPMLVLLLAACGADAGPDAGPVAGAGTDPDVIDLRMDCLDPPQGGLPPPPGRGRAGRHETAQKCACGESDGPNLTSHSGSLGVRAKQSENNRRI
jgi:hypothetical protein